MKRTHLVTAIAMLIMVLISACSQTPTGQVTKQETIKIGVLAPLTGPVAKYGEYTRQGFDMAVKEINAQGGVNGKQIELIYEDTKCIDFKGTLSAMNKLKQIDEVAAILGPYCSGTTKLAAQYSTDNKVLIISAGDNFGKIGDYFISTRYLIADEARLIAKQIIAKGKTKAGILRFDGEWGLIYKKVIGEELKENNAELVADEKYSFENLDVRTQLLKIRESGAEAIVVIDVTTGVLFKQVKELRINLPVLSEGQIENPVTKKEMINTIEGVQYFFPIVKITSFHDKYRAKYNAEPNFVSADAYDATNILAQALEACPDYETECMTEYVINLKDYPGAGGSMSFNKEKWGFDKDFRLKTVRDREYVFVE